MFTEGYMSEVSLVPCLLKDICLKGAYIVPCLLKGLCLIYTLNICLSKHNKTILVQC